MSCTPLPLHPFPAHRGDGEKFVVGFAHTEQGSALYPASLKRNAFVLTPGSGAGRPQWVQGKALLSMGRSPISILSPSPRRAGKGAGGRGLLGIRR